MLGRINLRRHWRAAAALSLLIGFTGTVVLACAAGARRTSTSFERFQEYSRSADVEVLVDARTASDADLRAFEQSEEVRDVARLRTFAINVGDDMLPTAAALDERFGTIVDRPRVIEGRDAHPSAANEVAIGETLAARMGIRPGDKLPLLSYSPQQVEDILQGGDLTPPSGLALELDVVGIIRRPLDLASRGATGGVLVMTPAFAEQHSEDIGSFPNLVLRVRTRNGAADVPAVVERARQMFGDSEFFDVQSLGIEVEGTRDAIDVLTVAIALFAAIAGVASAVFIGLIAARQVRRAEDNQIALSSLGMTRASRVSAAAMPVVLAGIGGAVLAAIGVVLASPALPIGVARRADPDVGIHVDWVVLGLGFAAIVLLVAAIAVTAALSTTRASRATPSDPGVAGSPFTRLARQAGFAPAPAIGVGIALESGGRSRHIPLRAAMVGVLLGATGVSAALVFGASLNRVVETPAAYGWSWDVVVFPESEEVPSTEAGAPCGATERRATHDPLFSAVTAVCVFNVEVDGRPLTAWSFQQQRGVIEPTTVRGRAPRTADEIALGGETMRALDKRIGDSVTVQGPAESADYVVVGQVVLPSPEGFDPQALDDTATLTGAGLARVLPADRVDEFHMVTRLAAGTNTATLPRTPDGTIVLDSGEVVESSLPLEVERLQQVDRLPLLLAIFLALLATTAVAHALLSSVRRRGRELAVLRVIGLSRAQVRTILASQATTYAIVGGLIGIPLGILVGQWVWGAVAENLGVSTDAQLPIIAFVVIGLAVLVVTNSVGAFAAWRALRVRPAEALAVE
jgi:predicted lysophospholipase L1 biosynthesis ABC-type transport system permease subunit